MATALSGIGLDVGALALRATFVSERRPSPDLADLASVIGQLRDVSRIGTTLIETGALSRVDRITAWMASRQEPFELTRPPVPWTLDVPLPSLERVRLESPLEIVLTLPQAVAAGTGALIGLIVLAERVFTLPLRISAQRERLLAEIDEYRVSRTPQESAALDTLAESLRYPGAFSAQEIVIYDWADDPDAVA